MTAIAAMRGITRKRSGSMSMISSAAISSFTIIVPTWAAIAAPTLAASTSPDMNGPISRSIEAITAEPVSASWL